MDNTTKHKMRNKQYTKWPKTMAINSNAEIMKEFETQDISGELCDTI